MKLLHLSDIHFTLGPSFRELFHLKRIFGSINQYFFRYGEFALERQIALVKKVISLKADCVVISGDITGMALESEFKLAREILQPLFECKNTVLVPGNHDVYVNGSMELMERYFGDVLKGNSEITHMKDISLFKINDLDIIGLNPCRPRIFDSTGLYPSVQLHSLSTLLSTSLVKNPVIVTHYPTVSYDGASLYTVPRHCVVNVEKFVSTLANSNTKIRAIFHGHVHRSFSTTLVLPQYSIPVFNAGSCAGKHSGFNVYTIDGSGNGIKALERYNWDIKVGDYALKSL